ncbi:MAG: FtsQ-type POTRA domain-containing protein [Eggerthellaceae bacterium]|nr:FtsQ-type POTRA domain-containing protein [Eggerthellaceae bacterium]
MAKRTVTKRVKQKKTQQAGPQPKAARQSIATRKKWDLQTASAQQARARKEARGGEARSEDSRTVSTKVKDLSREEQGVSAQVLRRRRRLRFGIIGGLLFVIAAIIGLGMIYRSNLFAIEYLSVKGVRHLTASEMEALAAIPEDTTLLRVDTDAIRDRLLTDAWSRMSRSSASCPIPWRSW